MQGEEEEEEEECEEDEPVQAVPARRSTPLAVAASAPQLGMGLKLGAGIAKRHAASPTSSAGGRSSGRSVSALSGVSLPSTPGGPY